ncbi:MAG: hypothetical protein ACYS8K_01335 [Planctomycetota bacterium]|jgi:hypothetical protein
MSLLGNIVRAAGIGLAVATGLGLLGGAPPGGIADAAEGVELVVIATPHYVSDMPEGFTPAHLRVLLEQVSPDALGVEAPANLPDPRKPPYPSPDVVWIVKPWAEQRGIRVAPVGLHEADYEDQLEELHDRLVARGRDVGYYRLWDEFQPEERSESGSCGEVNGEESRRAWVEFHASRRELAGEDTPWHQRAEGIVENVRRLCRRHDGKRVAVVFGVEHAHYVAHRLSGEEGISLVQVERFLPLPEEAVAAQSRPLDQLRGLRKLNTRTFGDLPLGTLERLERQLQRVGEIPEFRNDYVLFRGKLLLHQMKPVEAMEEFEKLLGVDRRAVSAFDGKTRLRVAGRRYVSIAKEQAGPHGKALKVLDFLADSPQIAPPAAEDGEEVPPE